MQLKNPAAVQTPCESACLTFFSLNPWQMQTYMMI
ncbi:hypothetical protein N826_05840 [Skermanella aerolata KACC 11604]|jgi:hypothetical protein|nr:hypothetical protein N826_05840 [Skermanella aerolata KACC 11604]